MKILSFVFPGFTFMDLAPMQAFLMLPEATSQIVGQRKGIVASDAGVDVQATEDFHSGWKDPDILFVPGNTLGLFKQLQDDRTLDFLADVGSRAAWVTSVCNGSLLLGQLVCSRATEPRRTGTRVNSSACLARYPQMRDMSLTEIERPVAA